MSLCSIQSSSTATKYRWFKLALSHLYLVFQIGWAYPWSYSSEGDCSSWSLWSQSQDWLFYFDWRGQSYYLFEALVQFLSCLWAFNASYCWYWCFVYNSCRQAYGPSQLLELRQHLTLARLYTQLAECLCLDLGERRWICAYEIETEKN